MRLETWHPNFFILIINDNLISTRIERDFKGKGIIAHWGKRLFDIYGEEKLMYVWYPKTDYTESYIINKIIPQYEKCPNCTFDNIFSNPFATLKYTENKNNYNNNKFKELIKNMSITSWADAIFKNPAISTEIVGQGLAQIPKVAVSLFTTELGNKSINTGIGIIGNLINELAGLTSGRLKEELRAFFTNLMYSFTDPTPNQIRELKRNVQDLISGIRFGNFSTAFGAIVEEPDEIIGAIKSVIPQFGSFPNIFSGVGKGFSPPTYTERPIGYNRGITEVTPKIITTFDKIPITEEDMVQY